MHLLQHCWDNLPNVHPISSVNAFEKNNTVPTSALDSFTLGNVYVTGFRVENEG